MPECDYCGEEFDSEKELHRHWDEHTDKLNSHQKDKVKKAKRKHEEQKKASMKKRKRYAGYVLAAALGLILIGIVGSQLMSSSGSTRFGDLEGQPMMGQEDAAVTIVEFGDYRCPYCREFETDVFPKLKENFIDTGKVKFYFVNFPFLDSNFKGSSSTRAAVATECVYRQDPQQFWDFHHAVYKNQRSEHKDWATVDYLMSIARDNTEGLDYGELRSCIATQDTLKQVNQDRQLAQQHGVRSTPSVYVNGDLVKNWQYNPLAQKIQNSLN